jgi:Carboxypeptidase regulatory-like domain
MVSHNDTTTQRHDGVALLGWYGFSQRHNGVVLEGGGAAFSFHTQINAMKNARQFYFLFSFLFLTFNTQAQTLRGTIRAADDGQPVTGATVNIFFSKAETTPISLASNPDGEFTFESLKVGYYRCEVIALGFEPKYLFEVPVVAGKEQVLEIDLQRSEAQLPEVTIAARQSGKRPLQPLSEIPLTRDQTLRFPAMFFDPGRLAAAYPGVSQTDDGTNTMSIRGNSPAMLRWRIEGLDIVNPNHLPNAGTIYDAPAASSGGVLMFSAQMLDNSSLLTGAFPAGYGDAVAGVMDMNLRNGNTKQHEFTVQAGLVGLDLAAEGPMKKGSDNSYLFNYRYSTVGLLGQLGVSFGDEQINFQDLSFKLNFNGKKGGKYAIFGLAGLSENIFRHKEDTTEIKYDKDRYDIDFQSRTGVIGGSGRWRLGARNSLKAAVAFSAQKNDWGKQLANEIPDSSVWTSSEDIRIEERSGASLEWRLSLPQNQFSAGVQVYRNFFKANVFFPVMLAPGVVVPGTIYDLELDHLIAQPWLRWDWASRNGRLNVQVGAQFHYNDKYQKLAPAPRGLLRYRISEKHQVSASVGLYKQDAPIWAQFTRYVNQEKKYLPYISSFQTGFRHNWQPSRFWKINTEIFTQITKNLPTNSLEATSLHNTPEYISEFALIGNNTARNYGLEVGVERSLKSGWFIAANGTLLQSEYRFNGGEWLDSRWDIGHMANVTFGKEWQREKTATLTRTIGVGIRGVWSGGPRGTDISLTDSERFGRTVYFGATGYYRRYPDYFRTDLRVYWKRNLGDRRNSTFALDLQNLTGRQNLAYHFYDPYTGNIENKYQLGTIPNFSWRMEF